VEVYNFLNAQSQTLTTYATNPLWKVVDGPWRISSYAPETGETILAKNTKYTGPDKAHLDRLELLPFTSDAAEFDAVRAGEVDYGYLPSQDLNQQPYLKAHGFQLIPWDTWGIGLMVDNFANPKTGPMIKQLYIRQALQELINQPELVRDVLHGYGYPTYGPAPIEPANPYATAVEQKNPYPYSVSAAKSLLAEHGWKVRPDGTDTCSRPGSGAGDCGPGIVRGEALAFQLLYASGLAAGNQMMEAIKSSESTAGIAITLDSAPFNTVVSVANPCTSGSPSSYCRWDLANWSPAGGGWFYNGTPFPTGELLMACGSFLNSGSYCDPKANRLITETHTQPGLSAYHAYEAYLVKQLPVIWMPQAPYQLSEVKTTLHGAVPQNPVGLIDPANWYFAS
jgi:peptide/nickel transport system substrate-binding protein